MEWWGDYLCAEVWQLAGHPSHHSHEAEPAYGGALGEPRAGKMISGSTRTPDSNSDRVGEFAIGTNIDLKDVIGEILQDEKYPGVHIAFGNPYGAHTGAEWDSSTHIDVVGRKFNILGG